LDSYIILLLNDKNAILKKIKTNNGKKCPLQRMTNATFHPKKKIMAKNTKTDSK